MYDININYDNLLIYFSIYIKDDGVEYKENMSFCLSQK